MPGRVLGAAAHNPLGRPAVMSLYQLPAAPVVSSHHLSRVLAAAGDGHEMGEEGYVGSDPESPSTGTESPAPAVVQPFARYDPVLPAVNHAFGHAAHDAIALLQAE